MVRGLTIFQEWFKDFEDQYVLIGGTAAWISMEEAGLPFRGTKDLDIVLHIEVLTPAFGEKFWDFVRVGGYLKKEGEPGKGPSVYRFHKPQDEEFPFMLELFSRVPDGLKFVPPGHLTPIPIDEQISSLSAILLNEDYYEFVLSGRNTKLGMPPWVGADRLIPLKALAWMEMNERVRQGGVIESKKIKKHLADIVQLSALLRPDQLIEVSERLTSDLEAFAKAVKSLNQIGQMQAIDRILKAYGLNAP